MDADDGGDWFQRDGARRRPAGGRIWPSESMVIITTLIILFALFAFTPLLGSGNPALVFVFLLLGLSLMGLTFGPMGALLQISSTEVRYTGASFSYNVSSILAPSRRILPHGCKSHYGLAAVGVYLASMAALTLIALLLTHETRHQALNRAPGCHPGATFHVAASSALKSSGTDWLRPQRAK